MNGFIGKGIIAAIVTPFNRDSSQTVNIDEYKRLLNSLMGKGLDGIFICGGAGEFFSLTFPEKKQLIEAAVDEVGDKVQVYAGTGCITTKETIELTQIAESVGCHAASIIPPYAVIPNQDELYNHYKEIAEKTDIPIILYNYPKKTGVSITADLVRKLMKIEGIAGVKDSSGAFDNMIACIQLQDEKFSVLSGIDMYIYGALVYGARGSISSTAGIVPEYATQIYKSFQDGDYDNAKKKQNGLYPLRASYSLGTFPSVAKDALNKMGFDVGQPRKPILPLTPEASSKLSQVLSDMSII